MGVTTLGAAAPQRRLQSGGLWRFLALFKMSNSQWGDILTPAPLSTYGSIVGHFFTSFSFPLFAAYIAMTSSVKWWKKNTKPVEGAAIKLILVVYNFVISAVNVYCTSTG